MYLIIVLEIVAKQLKTFVSKKKKDKTIPLIILFYLDQPI